MRTLSEALKKILNGLAMQYEGDYLSDDEKKANLQRVLAEIEEEKRKQPPPPPTVAASAPKMTLTTQ